MQNVEQDKQAQASELKQNGQATQEHTSEYQADQTEDNRLCTQEIFLKLQGKGDTMKNYKKSAFKPVVQNQ